MILHQFALSSASYRVRIALHLKGLTYEARSYTRRAGSSTIWTPATPSLG